MRVALVTTVLAIGVTAAPLPAVGATVRNPTPGQISRAVGAAERSHGLWATVNVCDTRRFPHTIGVRGQMPALGFPAWLTMFVTVTYYSTPRHRFVPVSHGTQRLRLGRYASGLQQDGAAFTFPAHTGLLSARIDFVWRRSGKVLGETARRATAGHRDADFGDPRRFSALQCRIR